mgnify:CR=1 FL=1
MTAPYLLVLAHARSGSNYLLDLLGALDGVSTLGEFFNTAAKAQGQNHREVALAPFGGDPALFMEAARRDPLSTLEFRKNINGVKLFDGTTAAVTVQTGANSADSVELVMADLTSLAASGGAAGSAPGRCRWCRPARQCVPGSR